MFPSFFDHPEKIFFDQQEENEKIELLLRQHWITNIGWLTISVLLLILPVTFPGFVNFLTSINLIPPIEVVTAVLILWYLLILAFMIEKFLHWYFNIYIVTNLHIVDVNFHNLLNRDIVSVQIQDIQSQRPQVKGIFGSLFNYGDLIMETAAENQRLEFSKVPKPDVVADRIQDLQAEKEGGEDTDV